MVRLADRVLRLQVLLVEHVGAVAVRLDLRLEALRLRRLGGEIGLRCGSGGSGERRRAQGQTEHEAQGQVASPQRSATAVGANAPPRHG